MSVILCLSSFTWILLKYVCVAGETEGNKRYIVEEDFKPAIFGSNKYNPILQIFEGVNEVPSYLLATDMAKNMTEIGYMGFQTTVVTVVTTVTPESLESSDTRAMFRQRVLSTNTHPANNWWAQLKNLTHNTTRPARKPKTHNNHL